MPTELHTARLRLRPLAPADREALHALWTEPAVRRYPWDDRVIDLATVDGVIERSTASFVYSLATACFGRGLASEAARAVIADAFERLGFERVLARTDPPNRASLGVMKRLGMRYAGEAIENGLPTVSYTTSPREDWRRAVR